MQSPHLAVEGTKLIFSHNGKVPILDELNISVKKGHMIFPDPLAELLSSDEIKPSNEIRPSDERTGDAFSSVSGNYGLLGPSGCGKTTLLRCILGRLQPESGEIRIYGRKPGETGFCIPGKGVGYMPQELALYSEITVEENLQYFGQLYEMSNDKINERISFLVHLLKIPDKKSVIKNLSGGQMRRVSFATALIHKPPLLVLDEPTVGVDPVLRRNIWAHLKTLATDDHVTIIITTHYVEEACNADMVGLMRKGYLLAEENPKKLIEQHGLNTLEEVFFKLSTSNEPCLQASISAKTIETTVDSAICNNHISLSASVETVLFNGSFRPNTKSLQAAEFSDNSNNDTHNSSTCFEKEVHALLYHNKTKSERFKTCIQRTRALIKKSFIELKRNIPFTVFQFCVPAFQVVLICMCIARNPFNLPMAIVNMETEHGFSRQLLEKLDNETIIQVPYSNLSSAINSVKIGETWGVLYIEKNFTRCLLKRFLDGRSVDNGTIWGSSIKLYLDMTNQQITLTLWYTISISFQEFTKNLLIAASENPLLAESPIVVADPVYGSRESTFLEFLAPNMLLSVNYFMAVALTTMSIFLEKQQGLLERSMVAGVQCSEIIFTILLTMFFVMLGQVILVLVVVLSVFQIPIHGSIIGVFVCILTAGIGGMALGLFISAISQSENMAVVLAVSVYTISLELSGLFWPIEAMNSYLKYISYCMPLTFLCNTIRSVMLRGWGITENNIWIGLVVSMAWIILFIMLAHSYFNRKK